MGHTMYDKIYLTWNDRTDDLGGWASLVKIPIYELKRRYFINKKKGGWSVERILTEPMKEAVKKEKKPEKKKVKKVVDKSLPISNSFKNVDKELTRILKYGNINELIRYECTKTEQRLKSTAIKPE